MPSPEAGPDMQRRHFVKLLGSAAAVWPGAAWAQQSSMPVVGFLNSTSPEAAASFVSAFNTGLAEGGFVEGRNVRIEYRWAQGQYDRLPELASELSRLKVNVIAASGGDLSAFAAKNATPVIPIVSVIGGDPVSTGLVANLPRPGGNLTGVSFLTTELMPKRLDLLTQLVPDAKVVALLINPNSPQTEGVKKGMQEAAGKKAIQLRIVDAGRENEIEAAFDAIKSFQVNALVVAADPFFNSRAEQLTRLASSYAIPAIYEWRGMVAAGGLISYGTSLVEVYRQVGVYAGKILAGESPANLPVLQPTKFELVINLKAAKALGIKMPASLLVAAEELIE